MPRHNLALVTGASAGIGLSFAQQLAAAGTDLVLVARRAERLEALAHELRAAHGTKVEVLVADLEGSAGVDRVARRLAEGAPVDLLVNNAGFGWRELVAEFDEARFAAMIAVNIVALSRLSRAALRQMLPARAGAIVNVSSGTIFLQRPDNSVYGGTKSFVAAFTRTMQAETLDSGVQVQLLIPGLVATEFHQVARVDLGQYPPERVMNAADLVAASLRALDQGEPVCIPSLPDVADWLAFTAAEARVAANVSRRDPADRYRQAGSPARAVNAP